VEGTSRVVVVYGDEGREYTVAEMVNTDLDDQGIKGLLREVNTTGLGDLGSNAIPQDWINDAVVERNIRQGDEGDDPVILVRPKVVFG